MLTIEDLWILSGVLFLLLLGVTIWLVMMIILRQRVVLESDTTQNDLRSTIYGLKEELERCLETRAEYKSSSQQYQQAYENQRQMSTQLSQESAMLVERLKVCHDRVLQYEALDSKYETLKNRFEESRLELSTALSDTRSRLLERDKSYEKLKEAYHRKELKVDRLVAELSQVQSQGEVLKSELEGQERSHQEKIDQMDAHREQMRLEFSSLADKILKENSQEFAAQSSKNITEMINPMRDQFDDFKKQIHTLYLQESNERSMLQSEIKNIKEINLQMSQEANNLTNALKGESKTQGIWGEMILERVLENSGLKQGESYEREVALRHESDESLYRPDVIVYLPDNREVIVDAKTSLTAYERFVSSQSELSKQKFADQHIASMKKHIKELSAKDYTRLKGVKSLDFVFMFIPVESALLMAMEYDPNLFEYAFKKNIILVGPTTLMVALRAVENSWKYEHQRQNATKIATRAGLLFDKFVGFVESVEKLGKQINSVQKTYDETYNRLHMGSGSITSQFYKLEKLGAATSKKLPNHLLNELES